MAADHVEHAITYWVIWQAFHSPLLAGFAVISHWVPHLFFGVIFGGLADRYDCRRIVQAAQGLFMLASLGWGVLIVTNSLQPWSAVLMLSLHGLAAALWGPAEQMMIYDIVGPRDLPSAVRLMATGLNLGMVIGPLIGALLLFTIGPGPGMFVNVLLYVPFIVYLGVVPFSGHTRTATPRGPRVTLRATFGVLAEATRYPAILTVFLLQGAVGLLIGTSLLPLLPEFGEQLGATGSGLGYGALITAMSVGAVAAGIGLEAIGRIRASVRLAIGSTIAFAASLVVFAMSDNLLLSVGMLVLAGAGNLVSASTSQMVVQLEAPVDRRGRFLGAYSMTSMGLRVGSGIIIGVVGGLIGPTIAIGLDATVLLVFTIGLLLAVLFWRTSRVAETTTPTGPAVEPVIDDLSS